MLGSTDTLLRLDVGRDSVLLACGRAVNDVEEQLDSMVDEGTINALHAYEVVARQRSTAEFLLRRLDAICDGKMDSWPAKAELHRATESLDATIDSYMREGFEFSCRRILFGGAPYSHWWISVSPLSLASNPRNFADRVDVNPRLYSEANASRQYIDDEGADDGDLPTYLVA